MLRLGQRAQSAFEIKRRGLLPVTYGSQGRCDVRIGRFCYWYDPDSPDPPPEPEAIAGHREVLLEELEKGTSILRGDDWFNGQLVRYLIEAGRADSAVTVAGQCIASAHWCRALLGLALHSVGRYEEADSAFALALTSMGADDRCRWEDLGDVLPDGLSRAYAKLDCDARRDAARRLWTLADPSLSRPGNDRRTEHLSRHVLSELERTSRSTYATSWGEDTHRLVIRYGWPSHWSRRPSTPAEAPGTNIVGHEPHPAFSFFPALGSLDSFDGLSTTDWRLDDDGARSRYATAYARRVVPLNGRAVRLPRRDSLLVVIAIDPISDTTLAGASTSAIAAAVDESGVPQRVDSIRSDGTQREFRMMLAATPALAAVELADSAGRMLGVFREFVTPPVAGKHGARLSDPVLFAAATGNETDIGALAGRLLGDTPLPLGSTTGLYWELERAGTAADTVTWTITVAARDAGLRTRIARLLRLSPGAAPVHISFTEPVRGGGPAPVSRSLILDLGQLPRGAYELRIRAVTGTGELAESARQIRIR
ncbi:MAG: hypothetical protein ACT4OZ_02105 [Gemmatimonadota bacterium]